MRCHRRRFACTTSSLLPVGTGTLEPTWPIKPGLQPSEQAKNAGAQGKGKGLECLAETVRVYRSAQPSVSQRARDKRVVSQLPCRRSHYPDMEQA